MIEISLLEQLDAFARTGTLLSAAEKLHTSQPALTRSMKKLEADLGVELFIRTKNHLELNEVGILAAKYAREVLDANVDFEARVKAYAKSLKTISIGYCAPVPQTVLTPIINTVFDGMTISSYMGDDTGFVEGLKNHEYHLAVLHEKPEDRMIFAKKCGHEELYISLMPGDPLTFYPEIHLVDLEGKSILLLTSIGFWQKINESGIPSVSFLPQIDASSFRELITNSAYPSFTSSYYIRRGDVLEGKINVALADPECRTDYYLACLDSEKLRYRKLFDRIDQNTI